MNREEITKKEELIKKVVPSELLEQYDLVTIASGKWSYGPGKFEGEPFATLYYYDCFLNGGEVVFEIEQEEREAFGIGEGYKYVYLYTSDNGFVHLYFYATREEAEQAESEDSEEESEE